jgi:hypothetical protein
MIEVTQSRIVCSVVCPDGRRAQAWTRQRRSHWRNGLWPVLYQLTASVLKNLDRQKPPEQPLQP